MKKVILYNSKKERNIQYIFSKNRCAIYYINKETNDKSLAFYKNQIQHRPCNIGPQFRNKNFSFYMENDKFHNLYGPAYISEKHNSKQYWIYSNLYNEYQFIKYIETYNLLSYKRLY